MSGLLDAERAVLERYLPGLDKQLADVPFEDLERRGGPGIELFRKAGGPGLAVPTVHKGLGATAVDAARATRALAARAPSLAIATTMHQFSVASLVALAQSTNGFEWLLLEGIAVDGRLMASGFAEGRTGQGILAPTMVARRSGESWLVSGTKRPCSLSRSMDLLTASCALTEENGEQRLGVALIPAESPGIRVEPFWSSPVLAGAESDAVILEDVEVHPELVVYPDVGLDGQLDNLQTIGFIWFELLVSACYLGMAGALVERVLDRGRGTVQERADLATAVTAAGLTIDAAARTVDEGDLGNGALGRSLVVRFSTVDTVARVVPRAVEALGGMAFINEPEVAYLAAAANAIGFHPPSRHSAAPALVEWFGGQPLVIQ